MFLNGEQAEVMRKNVQPLLDGILPFKPGTDVYKDVCGDYKGKPGTTCGFLCHWLMWRLGVTNGNFSDIKEKHGIRHRVTINRTADGFFYKDGDNISCIAYCTEYRRVTGANPNPLLTSNGLQAGDIIHLYPHDTAGDNSSEHVFVFVKEENGVWTTAEAGQDYGTWGKYRADRKLRIGMKTKITGVDPLDKRQTNMSFDGYLPLDQLDFGPPPVALPFPFL